MSGTAPPSAPHTKATRPKPDRPEVPRLALSPEEVAEAIGMGVTRTREIIRAGKIKSVRIGRRVLVTPDAIRAFLANQGG